MKRTYQVINKNYFQEWCDKHNLRPLDVYNKLKEKWPKLNIQYQSVRFWYAGTRNIDPKNAPFIHALSNGELSIENILYPPNRLEKINNIMNHKMH
jgi:hypothetical protein